LVLTSSLVGLYDFENRQKLFVDVDSRMKFALLTAGSGALPIAREARFAFFCHSVDDLADPERTFVLTPEDILLLNPNTKNCPVFRSRRDAEITKRIYRLHPVLVDESDPAAPSNPWGIRFSRMFDMSNDSHLFRTREVLIDAGYTLEGNVFKRPGAEDMLPLYEGKMFNLFNDRWAHVESDAPVGTGPDDVVMPRYWVPVGEVPKEHDAFIAARGISNATNERTYISSFTPFPIGMGHSAQMVGISQDLKPLLLRFYAAISSFAFDFVVRQKLGGTNVTFSITEQFVMPSPETMRQAPAIEQVVCRLYSASASMCSRFESMGFPCEMTPCNEAARGADRARIDAWAFKLFGYTLDEVDHVMDTFPIVRKKDEAEHGEYRTKRLILEAFSSL